jgi:hypothetical protein
MASSRHAVSLDDPNATFRIWHHSRATSSMAAALICVERMICQAVMKNPA